MKLKIKEHPFGVFHSVTSHDLDVIWNAVLEIDCFLMPSDSKSAVINTKPQHSCSYMFSIKKCGESECSIYL